MSRQALLIGAAPGDGTGDPARTGGNKINLNFTELYAFLGGDTLPSVIATAGRLVIGNGSSGLTDDANLTWDATNKRLGIGGISPAYSLEVSGTTTLRDSDTYSWNGLSSSLVKVGIDSNGNGLMIQGGSSNPTSGMYFSIWDHFGGPLLRMDSASGLVVNRAMSNSSGFFGGYFFNLSGVLSRNIFSDDNNVSDPAAGFWDQRASLAVERTFPLVWWGGVGSNPVIAGMTGGINAIDDGTRKGTALYSYTGSALVENFRALDDQSVRFAGGNIVLQSAALATTATDGFTYIPTSAGAPTGAPTAFTGTVAMQYDTTNNNLYVYNGAWKKVALA